MYMGAHEKFEPPRNAAIPSAIVFETVAKALSSCFEDIECLPSTAHGSLAVVFIPT